MRRASLGAGWAWGIGAAALLLSVWAVLDFVEAMREEAARFRALSPLDQVKAFRSVLSAGCLMMKNSPNKEFIERYTLEQEELEKQAIRDFIARHVR